MMSTYKPPHYITLGIYVMVKTPDDKIVGVPMAVEEVSEDGIGAEIEKAVTNLKHAGLTPVTKEEHKALAQEWLDREQMMQLTSAMRKQVEYNATDPDRLDKMIADHKGRPGGDA